MQLMSYQLITVGQEWPIVLLLKSFSSWFFDVLKDWPNGTTGLMRI